MMVSTFYINNNNNNGVQPRGSFAQPVVWRPGTALDLASQWPGTRDEPLSMRGECTTVRGQILDFVEPCNIYTGFPHTSGLPYDRCVLANSYCRFPHTSGLPLDSCVLANSYSWFPHTSGLPLERCLLPNIHARWREKNFSHFIEL